MLPLPPQVEVALGLCLTSIHETQTGCTHTHASYVGASSFESLFHEPMGSQGFPVFACEDSLSWPNIHVATMLQRLGAENQTKTSSCQAIAAPWLA